MHLEHPQPEEFEMARVLHALSDPQRLHIVRELDRRGEPVPCGAIELEVTKSTASHHFRILREAGVISQTKVGTSKTTGLRSEDLNDRFPGLLQAVLAADAVPAA